MKVMRYQWWLDVVDPGLGRDDADTGMRETSTRISSGSTVPLNEEKAWRELLANVVIGLHIGSHNAIQNPNFPNPQRQRKAVLFNFFPVGHKDNELYVRMLNKQAAEPLHTVLDDGLACPSPVFLLNVLERSSCSAMPHSAFFSAQANWLSCLFVQLRSCLV